MDGWIDEGAWSICSLAHAVCISGQSEEEKEDEHLVLRQMVSIC